MKNTYPKVGLIYTVRFIDTKHGEPCLLLEEIVNDICEYSTGFEECLFRISRFRELLPPIDDIEQNIKEQTLEIELV